MRTRVARPIWDLLPDVLPGYQPINGSALAAEYKAPREAGLDLLAMMDAAAAASWLRCTLWARTRSSASAVDPAALDNTFTIVQDMFLTETAALADVVFPASNLYEKSAR